MNLLKFEKGIYDISKIDGIRFWKGDYRNRQQEYCALVEVNGNSHTLERTLFSSEEAAKAYYMRKIEKVMLTKLGGLNKGNGIMIWEEL